MGELHPHSKVACARALQTVLLPSQAGCGGALTALHVSHPHGLLTSFQKASLSRLALDPGARLCAGAAGWLWRPPLSWPFGASSSSLCSFQQALDFAHSLAVCLHCTASTWQGEVSVSVYPSIRPWTEKQVQRNKRQLLHAVCSRHLQGTAWADPCPNLLPVASEAGEKVHEGRLLQCDASGPLHSHGSAPCHAPAPPLLPQEGIGSSHPPFPSPSPSGT